MTEETAPLERVQPDPGQQSVWDYPSPPAIESEVRRIRVYVAGIPIVDTTNAIRVMETGRPPTIYIPRQAFRHCDIRRLKHQSDSGFKGTATYFTLIAAGKIAHRAAWEYVNPHGPYRALIGHLAVYPSRVDRALMDEEEALAQDGEDWGGWVTSEIVGPFKGEPGTAASPAVGPTT